MGTGEAPIDPRVRPLANNGGPTHTHALFKGSPAINNGNPASLGSGRSACSANDQRGVPRKDCNELVKCQGRTVNRVGTDGNDKLKGTGGVDGLLGLGGRDKLSGRAGKDGLCGGKGKDTLRGGSGNDKLYGQGGKDTCIGQGGRDRAGRARGRGRSRDSFGLSSSIPPRFRRPVDAGQRVPLLLASPVRAPGNTSHDLPGRPRVIAGWPPGRKELIAHRDAK